MRVSLVVPVEPLVGVFLVFLDLRPPSFGSVGRKYRQMRHWQKEKGYAQYWNSRLHESAMLHVKESIPEEVALRLIIHTVNYCPLIFNL